MTPDEASALLKAAAFLCPTVLEAVAVFVENTKVDGGYGGNSEEGDFYINDSPEETLSKLADTIRGFTK